MYKLCFYVPESHLDVVKQAVFAAGGGRIGRTTVAAGSPLARASSGPWTVANPTWARSARSSTWRSGKWSCVVADELIHASVKALKAAHPYETPAYEVWRLTDMVF